MPPPAEYLRLVNRIRLGLLLAINMSMANVVRDALTKRVLQRESLLVVTVWLRGIVALASIILLVPLLFYLRTDPNGAGALWHVVPGLPWRFWFYLALNVLCVGLGILLYSRALQVAPLSLVAPFQSFVLVFLIPMSVLLVHEWPTWPKLIGCLLVFVGSLAIHRLSFRKGMLAPLFALIRERGSGLSLLAALLFSLTNPLDKKLVAIGGNLITTIGYSVSLMLLSAVLALSQLSQWRIVFRNAWRLLLLAGIFDLAALVLQFTSYRYLSVVQTVSIKRAGVLLEVIVGLFFFHERQALQRLSAALIMVGGVLVMCFATNARNTMGLCATVILLVMFVERFLIPTDLTPSSHPTEETIIGTAHK